MSIQINAVDEIGNTALHWVASRGVLSMSTILIDKGASVDEKNAHGDTPLHKAAINGQVAGSKEPPPAPAHVRLRASASRRACFALCYAP